MAPRAQLQLHVETKNEKIQRDIPLVKRSAPAMLIVAEDGASPSFWARPTYDNERGHARALCRAMFRSRRDRAAG